GLNGPWRFESSRAHWESPALRGFFHVLTDRAALRVGRCPGSSRAHLRPPAGRPCSFTQDATAPTVAASPTAATATKQSSRPTAAATRATETAGCACFRYRPLWRSARIRRRQSQPHTPRGGSIPNRRHRINSQPALTAELRGNRIPPLPRHLWPHGSWRESDDGEVGASPCI